MSGAREAPEAPGETFKKLPKSAAHSQFVTYLLAPLVPWAPPRRARTARTARRSSKGAGIRGRASRRRAEAREAQGGMLRNRERWLLAATQNALPLSGTALKVAPHLLSPPLPLR